MRSRAKGKKLKDAVRFFYFDGGRGHTKEDIEELQDELDKFGINAEIEEPEERCFDIHQDNWEAFRLFIACHTQWRRVGMGGDPVGLDYPAMKVTAEFMTIPVTPDIFESIRIMELAVLRGRKEAGVKKI